MDGPMEGIPRVTTAQNPETSHAPDCQEVADTLVMVILMQDSAALMLW